jgi:polar amino acid transport system substrate-binding protein
MIPPVLALALLLFAMPLLQAGLAPTGTLRAAFLATNPVQGRVDPQTGAVTGPVADLVRELGRRLAVPVRLVPVPDASTVIAQVVMRQVDIGFLAYEAERAAQVDFSAPYALMGSAYLVRADSPFASSADVDRPGVTIGAVKGQSQQIYVSEHVSNARIEMVATVPGPAALVEMLTGGRIQAFAANRQRMEEVARSSPQVRVLRDNFMVNGQAMVVTKGDAARLAELNRFLNDVLASGFVKASLERNNAAGVEVAPLPPG